MLVRMLEMTFEWETWDVEHGIQSLSREQEPNGLVVA